MITTVITVVISMIVIIIITIIIISIIVACVAEEQKLDLDGDVLPTKEAVNASNTVLLYDIAYYTMKQYHILYYTII